jgi:hypothetical protein
MLHENVPQYVKDAAAKNEQCTVVRITVRNNTVVKEREVLVSGKIALQIFSTPQAQRKGTYSRIRPLGQTGLQAPVVVDPTILSDEALRLEFEKRFPQSEKAKGRPKKVESEVETTDSLLSDPTLQNTESND